VSEVDQAFEEFAQTYGKSYASQAERDMRFAAFEHNYRVVQEKNAQDLPYKLAINEFADQNATKFAAARLGLATPQQRWGGAPYLGRHMLSGETAAEEMDWVTKGAVTPVKNQKQCGSCWAFSTTGALEGAWQVATGELVSVSEQQLIDCDTKSSDRGCNGGLMDYAFTYLSSNAACTEDSYPYTATDGNACKADCDVAVPKGSVSGYKDVDAGDSAALIDALNLHPVSVAIEADQASFQMYKSGVLTAECDAKLDHGVLAVGYGTTEDGLEYWKIKNSWGPSWGENGYVRIQRGERKSDDECGVKDMASYPVVSSSPTPTPAPTPTPTPTPSPTPTPTPGPYTCIFAVSEEECEATKQNGERCTWCSCGDIGGLCMDPDYDCDADKPPTCRLQANEEDCVAADVDGEECGWCVSSLLNGESMGHCMGSGLTEGFDCMVPPAPKSRRTGWLVPVVSVTAVSAASLIALLMYVQRRRRPAVMPEDLNISLQATA
jgi:C1A family cysteine protease